MSRIAQRCAWVSVLLVAGSVRAEGRVEEIPAHWTTSALRRLAVVRVEASSVLGDPEGQYAASRAVDGNRGTKWVASIEPSVEKPQWIELHLVAPQLVSAVAVFGEAVNNDGIQDGQVQVAGAAPGSFRTMAAIKDAKWGRWLASFEPVKTPAVRLLITRSYPPSPHTDVYEIELYGPPLGTLPAGELKSYVASCLDACRPRLASAVGVPAGAAGQVAGMKELGGSAERLRREFERAAQQAAQWDALDAAARESLVRAAERLVAASLQLSPSLERARTNWPVRSREILAARQAVPANVSEEVTAGREGRTIRLANRRVIVSLDERDGTWSATWLGGVEAAVHGVGFGLRVDQAELELKGAKTTVEPLADKLGPGMQIRQQKAGPIEVQRVLRVYHGKPAVVVSGHVTNASARDVTLAHARMVHAAPETRGWWHLGRLLQSPAAAGYPGTSPPCQPAAGAESLGSGSRTYSSSGVLALACAEPAGSLTIGHLTAREGSPEVQAAFRLGEGGTALGASLGYGGRVLPKGQSIVLDPVWVSAEENPYCGLERYGDAAAALAREPVHTGANGLWCSWYPIRMGISEEVVLANAAVAARHFRPLGLEVIQLDHGWQRGDVCGDWVPNERFAHGLAWLSEQLRTRFGMQLGLWIAPTVVAETSQLYKEHPDWLLRNPDGKPAPTGRWFWVPNPECYVLDASHPAAARWIEATFARLTAEGASYYKIDFIAGSGGGYVQHDPQCTRGWGVLAHGMQSIRRGAGPEAWIRYCQTPPLLSAGLANSSYLGDDTGDAGLENGIELLRINAPLLAASYWVNDRLYHREVCDMSVGLKAPVEEARLRMALMTLAGCSISFSDDFRQLALPRIRMMQQCLPPGNPPARPLDLFERELPSLWHLHCKNEADAWDVVGLFNFAGRAEERSVEFGRLGFAPGTRLAAFEFWEEKPLGLVQDRVTMTLPPQSSRIVLLRRLTDHPQVIGTNMHLLGGYHEIRRLAWDSDRRTLSGQYRRAPGLSGKAFLHVPAGYRPRADAARRSAALEKIGDTVWAQSVEFKEAEVDWSIPFDGPTR